MARRASKWNINKLKNPEVRNAFKRKLDEQLQDGRVDEEIDIDRIWYKLKENLELVAEEICGKDQSQRKQSWMTTDILCKMEERRISKKHERRRKVQEAKAQDTKSMSRSQRQVL